MTKEVNLCRDLLGGGAGRLCGGEEQALMEDTLEGLQERMGLLDSTLEPLCDSMKDSLQEHSTFQVQQNDHLVYFQLFVNLLCPALKRFTACFAERTEDAVHSFERK